MTAPTHTFLLPDMTCSHCVEHVTRALQQADASCTVRVDLPAKRVAVQSNHQAAVLGQALEDAGYPPARSAR